MARYRSGGWTITLPWSGVSKSDFDPHVREGYPVVLEFNWGRWVRPVLKPWYWFRENPWFQTDPSKVWFVLDLPFAGPFIAFRLFGNESYIGFKRFLLAHPEYAAWHAGPLGVDYHAIVLSGRI